MGAGRMFKRKSQTIKIIRGTTLIELMLVLTMGLLILSAVSVIYLAAQKNQTLQAALNTLQENGRAVSHFVSADIHLAGYIGCARLTNDFPLYNHTNYLLTAQNKIMGDQTKLTMWYAAPENVSLVEPMQDVSTLYVETGEIFHKGDWVMVSDCRTADIFIIDEVETINHTMQKITSTESLLKQYGQDATLHHIKIKTYFISDTGRQDPKGMMIRALYVKEQQQHRLELIEGIQDMQIKYDVNNNNRLVSVSADQIVDWSAVLGVSMQFTFSSLNGFPLQEKWNIYTALRE
jgi:type II secretory pathway pseudopilin PulG